MNYIDIGKFISKLRKDKKLTQEELAVLLNANSRTISKWENGLNVPDTVYLHELSNIFNVSIDELLDGKRKPKYSFLRLKYIIPIFIFLIMFLFLILYFINNYNKVKMYNIYFDNDFVFISGNSTFTQNDSIINIDKIEFENNIGVYELAIEIKNNDRVFYSNILEYNKLTSINDAFNSLNIMISNIDFDNTYITFDDIYNSNIRIIYTDSNFEDHILNIKLNYSLIFSNNKLFY